MTRPDYRARIAAHDGAIGAFVDETDEAVGDALAWAVKSNIAVKGLPHTAGIGAYSDRIAQEDAEVVRRIRTSGGTVLGTVNMHEAALGATTGNPVYGRTYNPWRMGFTPGGSSGGSGAAVAAGLCDVALGTDTMGSVRIPAAYCGVQGHKPTTGLVPTDGVVALSHLLDHVGPLARRVETLWRAMHVLADWGDTEDLVPADLASLRIGVWDGAGDVEMTAPVSRGFAQARDRVAATGAELSTVSPPAYAYSVSRRAGLLVSEVEGAAVHGIRPGTETREGFSEGFLSLLGWGLRQPPEKIEAAYAHIAEVRRAASGVWETVDVILAPTAPQQAFSFDAAAPANQADFTAWADFAALPATSIYTGLCDAGMPLALQVIGPESRDRETLAVAAALEALFGAPPMPPGFGA